MTKSITVKNLPINIKTNKTNDDFICLTDMAKFKGSETGLIISHWLTTKFTIEFLGLWEEMHNPNFNLTEFRKIKNEVGTNGFVVSISRWTNSTNAIKENLIPPTISKKQASIIYANEADTLNVALFGKTADEFRNENPKFDGNLRDKASLEQLIILTNLESINSVLIRQNLSQGERLIKLNEIAIVQAKSLIKSYQIQHHLKQISKIND